MRTRIWLAAGAAVALSAAAFPAGSSDAPVIAKTADVEISARILTDREAQVKAVGSDLKRQYVIVELTVKPRGGYPVTLSRENFLLRSERDNERATADSPDRIAGSAVLALGTTGGGRPVYTQSGEGVYVGGIPDTPGKPRRVGTSEDTIGSGGTPGSTTVTRTAVKETPLLPTLRQKELPLGETAKPVSGYLYFPVDPKQKTKNFHLHFKGPAESCELRFR